MLSPLLSTSDAGLKHGEEPEKVENGERHTFVIDLILALRQQGWLWTEEFIWHKKNSYPGGCDRAIPNPNLSIKEFRI
jgi:hypothetical protein